MSCLRMRTVPICFKTIQEATRKLATSPKHESNGGSFKRGSLQMAAVYAEGGASMVAAVLCKRADTSIPGSRGPDVRGPPQCPFEGHDGGGVLGDGSHSRLVGGGSVLALAASARQRGRVRSPQGPIKAEPALWRMGSGMGVVWGLA